MPDLNRSLVLAIAFAGTLVLPVQAQETTETETPAAEAPAATELPLGQEVAPAGPEPYVKSTMGDWQLRCLRVQDGSDPCEIYQLLKDEKGNSVAEITLVALPEGGEAAAGATVVVPLETYLPPQLRIVVDAGKAKLYPYRFCASVGCFAQFGFTAAEIEEMKKGAKATISVIPNIAPDQVVSVNVSLKGFTDAFEAVRAELPKKE